MTAPAGRGGAGGGAEADSVLLDEAALRDWGRRLGRAAAEGGVFVALRGPLGAGKSTLARAAAAGAGVEGAVPSPTYTLVHEHELPGAGGEDGRSGGGGSATVGGGRVLFHVDLYRLSGARDLEEIGWDRMLSARGPVFVEWAERAGEELPRDRWDVRLGIPEDRSRRRVELARRGVAPDPPPLPREAADGEPPAGAAAEGETAAGDGPC